MNRLIEEIYSQPDAVRRTLAAVTPSQRRDFASALGGQIVITGMGSSYSAAYYAACWLSERFDISAVAVEASELLGYQRKLLHDRRLMMISQSGRSAEIVDLLGRAKGTVIGLTNEAESPVTRHSDLTFLTHAGTEYAASTKTYTAALTLLLALSGSRVVERLPDLIERFLPLWDESAACFAEEYEEHQRFVLIGTGLSCASAMTGSLLFHEAAKLPAQGFSAAQFRHGPIEATSPDTVYVVFASSATRRLADEIDGFGGKVLSIGKAIPLPVEDKWLMPLLEIIPVQLLAARIGMQRGVEVDTFRFGQKVTVGP
jgi:glucosamine--fructose-6-phosphate aminotransferase (isomerizing)